jgi:predicted kinase
VRQLADEMARKINGFGGFSGFWLQLPLREREHRVIGRTGNVSDATPSIARQQEAYDQGPMDCKPVDASRDIKILEKRIILTLSGTDDADPGL